MGVFEKYFLIVNVVGFLIYFINYLLYRFTESANVDKLLTLVALAGGSLGIVVFIALFDRKSVKENMMSRVFVICVLIIQLVAVLFFKGVHGEQITFAFWEFFGKYKILIVYLVVINFISFAAFAILTFSASKLTPNLLLSNVFLLPVEIYDAHKKLPFATSDKQSTVSRFSTLSAI